MDESHGNQEFAYDRVPYPGAADGIVNLRHVEAVGSLFGIAPEPLSHCRVLELGCADGTNILPFAAEFPDSEFVGIDLAAGRIEEATAMVNALELTNIRFQKSNVSELDVSLGKFDYILCPGVFSWATDSERDAILRICRENLAPNGVAVVSFNVLPGWNFRGTVRELIQRHTRTFDAPQRQILEARRVVEFVASCTPDSSPHGITYAGILESLQTASDHYVFHDYISDRNQPFYFHEFAAFVQAANLQFVADADVSFSAAMSLPKEAREVLNRTPLHEREQLLDFLVNTSYRRALLCHPEVSVDRSVDFASMEGMNISLVKPFRDVEFDPADNEPLTLEYDGGSLTTTEPLGKAALQHLRLCWPAAVPIADFYPVVCQLLPAEMHNPASVENLSGSEILSQAMLAAYAAGLIRVFKSPPTVTTTVSANPTTTPLIRYLAANEANVVNQWHQNVGRPGRDEAFILGLLDGSRDVDQIAGELQQFRAELPSDAVVDERTAAEIIQNLASEHLLLIS